MITNYSNEDTAPDTSGKRESETFLFLWGWLLRKPLLLGTHTGRRVRRRGMSSLIRRCLPLLSLRRSLLGRMCLRRVTLLKGRLLLRRSLLVTLLRGRLLRAERSWRTLITLLEGTALIRLSSR